MEKSAAAAAAAVADAADDDEEDFDRGCDAVDGGDKGKARARRRNSLSDPFPM
jgi:hypothetical protein